MRKKIQKKRGPIEGTKLEQIQRSEFGKRLFAVRRAKGISQNDLGEKVGLSLRMVSYYERDVNGPPVIILKKIADALNVTASYLLGESPLKLPIRDELDLPLKKAIDKLKNLPKKDQKNIIQMIEALEFKNTGVKK